MSDEILRVLDALADEKGEDRVRRARAELERKDAAIKALADALELHGMHREICPAIQMDKRRGACTCGLDAALRLAGRLP